MTGSLSSLNPEPNGGNWSLQIRANLTERIGVFTKRRAHGAIPFSGPVTPGDKLSKCGTCRKAFCIHKVCNVAIPLQVWCASFGERFRSYQQHLI
jgi:hypothetical protein